jgi:hypothetical protein
LRIGFKNAAAALQRRRRRWLISKSGAFVVAAIEVVDFGNASNHSFENRRTKPWKPPLEFKQGPDVACWTVAS